ncbi:MAG TPA: hypothetical protein VHT91_45590 [Kofleriaceae bacterium]|jgi:hypothetical protein|nr:hypothetical protein [Kofleriaceae bacterium]
MSTSILSRIIHRTVRRPDRGPAPGRARWKLAAATLGVALGATSAAAAIVATAPAFIQITPAPPSVVLGALQSDMVLFSFNERQCLPVPAGGLKTDGGVIPAGTLVSSHFLHGDPVTNLLLSGQVLFNGPILGVISSSGGLDASDVPFGAPGTTYPTGFGPRGLEAGMADAYAIIAGGFGIAARMEVPPLSFLDQIRVITRCCPGGPGGACPGAPGGPGGQPD